MEYILEEDHDSEIEENVSEDEDYLEVNDEDSDYDQSDEETDICPDETFMWSNSVVLIP